jgi:hypothetical protein
MIIKIRAGLVHALPERRAPHLFHLSWSLMHFAVSLVSHPVLVQLVEVSRSQLLAVPLIV